MASKELEQLRAGFERRKAQRKAAPPTDAELAAALPGYRAQNDAAARKSVVVPEGVRIGERTLGGRWGEFYHVEGSRQDRIILYLHGVGWENGSVVSRRYIAMNLGIQAKTDCFSASYTQWPEGRFEEGLNDCLSVFGALRGMGYAPGSITVAGESAGATMALSMALALKSKGEALPGYIVAYCAVTDLTDSFPSRSERDALDPMISPSVGRTMLAHFCGGQGADDPIRCVCLGDYSGFPPTFIGVGSDEVLLDDSVDLHRRLTACGVRNELRVYEGLYHAFMMLPSPEAEACLRETAAFLNG